MKCKIIAHRPAIDIPSCNIKDSFDESARLFHYPEPQIFDENENNLHARNSIQFHLQDKLRSVGAFTEFVERVHFLNVKFSSARCC